MFWKCRRSGWGNKGFEWSSRRKRGAASWLLESSNLVRTRVCLLNRCGRYEYRIPIQGIIIVGGFRGRASVGARTGGKRVTVIAGIHTPSSVRTHVNIKCDVYFLLTVYAFRYKQYLYILKYTHLSICPYTRTRVYTENTCTDLDRHGCGIHTDMRYPLMCEGSNIDIHNSHEHACNHTHLLNTHAYLSLCHIGVPIPHCHLSHCHLLHVHLSHCHLSPVQVRCS